MWIVRELFMTFRKMKNDYYVIEEGYTNSLLLPALFILFAGLTTTLFSVVTGLVIAVFSVPFFFAKSGWMLDHKRKRCRSYNKVLGYVSGAWEMLDHFHFAAIANTREAVGLASRGSAITVRVNTYDLKVSVDGKTYHLLYEFSKYHQAKEALFVLQQYFQWQTSDKIAMARAAAMARRKEKAM